MPPRITKTDPAELQQLLPGVGFPTISELAAFSRTMSFGRGETVLTDVEPVPPAMVAGGTVRLVVRAADGREATLRTARRGAMFGLAGLFDAARGPAGVERAVVAVDAATMIVFDRGSMLRLARQHAGLAIHVARNLADSANVLADTAGHLAFMSVAGELLRLAEPGPDGRRIASTTQQELANAIGSVREVVARTLHELRDDGLVAIAPGRVEILDPRRLAAGVVDVA